MLHDSNCFSYLLSVHSMPFLGDLRFVPSSDDSNNFYQYQDIYDCNENSKASLPSRANSAETKRSCSLLRSNSPQLLLLRA